mmetsp:Transcript_26977/g.58725  ORF Transcript_26977/g.58725 Transcript_26977/m.58725 type:complete len:270 (-) Transcript_26977:228-1037(-)
MRILGASWPITSRTSGEVAHRQQEEVTMGPRSGRLPALRQLGLALRIKWFRCPSAPPPRLFGLLPRRRRLGSAAVPSPQAAQVEQASALLQQPVLLGAVLQEEEEHLLVAPLWICILERRSCKRSSSIKWGKSRLRQHLTTCSRLGRIMSTTRLSDGNWRPWSAATPTRNFASTSTSWSSVNCPPRTSRSTGKGDGKLSSESPTSHLPRKSSLPSAGAVFPITFHTHACNAQSPLFEALPPQIFYVVLSRPSPLSLITFQFAASLTRSF